MTFDFCIALSRRLFRVTHYPPRCGGLLRIAPIGAKNKTTILANQNHRIVAKNIFTKPNKSALTTEWLHNF
jgi:hypothetical protein